jgi:hypothetical protein
MILPALVLALFQYALPAEPVAYTVEIGYKGFIPVFGGQEGTFKARLDVSVQSLSPDSEGRLRASSEVTGLKVWFNDAELPFGVETIQNYFPRTTIRHTANGKILDTDAPNVTVPVRLPGLDVKRFPDISYMPVEFPAEPLEPEKSWTFRKRFGDSDVVYTATPTAIDAQQIVLKLSAEQEYEVLEDEAKQVVADESAAAARVKTRLTADGVATFDRSRGLLLKLSLQGLAVSEVKELKSGQATKRELKSTLDVEAKPKG